MSREFNYSNHISFKNEIHTQHLTYLTFFIQKKDLFYERYILLSIFIKIHNIIKWTYILVNVYYHHAAFAFEF